ncbi:Serine/arginine-rich splicing factor SR45a, partial [Mucuna pruriens]
SASVSPVKARRSRSLSRSRKSRSRSHDSADAENPGNNLYVTGLSTRITDSDLHKYFSKEGKVIDCHLVKDPRTKVSRGFGFVTMETNDDAECCIKYLNRSVFEGRLITVEKKGVALCSLSLQREIVAGLQLLADTVVQEISGDRDQDDLVVTRLSDGRIEIIIQGNGEEDLALHTVGGWKITLTHTGGGGISPCQLGIVDSSRNLVLKDDF